MSEFTRGGVDNINSVLPGFARNPYNTAYSAHRAAQEPPLSPISDSFSIVRTYSDAGRSGLVLAGREALRQLLDDILSGCADFQLVPVDDVSGGGVFRIATKAPITNTCAGKTALK